MDAGTLYMNPTDQEIEAVARAMGERHGLVWDVDTGCHDYWRDVARAAIAALDQARKV